MSAAPVNPADQFRELADAGDKIAEVLTASGAPNQANVVTALAQIVREVADQLDAGPPDVAAS